MYTLVDNFPRMSQTKTVVMSFRVPQEMKKKVQEIAKEQRRTVGSIMREIIENFVKEYELEKNINN